MKRARLILPAVAAIVAVGVPTLAARGAVDQPGLAAATPRASSSSSSSSVSVTPYSPPAAPSPSASATATTITASGDFSVRVDRTGKKALDDTWPSAGSVFTVAELRQVLPGLSTLNATNCSTGTVTGGGSSSKPMMCTVTLNIKGESADDRSRLVVAIRGFGLPKTIGDQWTKDLKAAQQRSATRPGLYTFYANKSLGASAAFTDGTTTKVLLQHGDVAGEIWFSGIGFTKLSTKGYTASRQAYRTEIVPALVKLLADKLDGKS